MARPKVDHPLTGAERAARLRGRGKPVSVVLRNPAAIEALDRLATGGISQGDAIERALVAFYRLMLSGVSSRSAQ